MSDTSSSLGTRPDPVQPKRPWLGYVLAGLIAAVLTFAITALLTTIFWNKVEATQPFVRVVEVTEDTVDAKQWGLNWPRQYDTYIRTVDPTHTTFGGSEALPKQKAERDPWLTRMFAGYAFSIDYRDRRGHAYMLFDQEQTERVTKRPQPGACLHCHASVMPLYRELGNGDEWAGFVESCKMTYADANKKLHDIGAGHPVSCVDCHDPDSMKVRVTRPGFIKGIQALAASDDPVPHLPSVERWRKGSRTELYDPNAEASRQEMRSFTCGQCHVEYYCGPKETLFFPWHNGLKVEQIEKTYNEHTFPDGHRFFDWKHAETGAEVLKAQHPEFEMWSQGIHARSGVSCSDCHMAYMRDGAMKISDHHVRSPLLNMSRACLTCHNQSEEQLQAAVASIQGRTRALMDRAGKSMIDMLDAIVAAKKAGVPDDQLTEVFELQRKAKFRLDFVVAENSMGFHAPPEAARILGESVDYARQAQVKAIQLTGALTSRPPATQPVAAR